MAFCFGFCKKISHCKVLAQLTPSNSEMEKDSSQKGKQRVTGKENSLLYVENYT